MPTVSLRAATPAQIAALDAYIKHDTYKGAAHQLRISPRAVQHRIERLRKATGMNTLQLAWQRGYDLRREWLTLKAA